MGCNYYACSTKPTVLSPLHIGKSSYGWKFHFHKVGMWENPFDEHRTLDTYEKWADFLEEYTHDGTIVILDECDDPISCKDFLNMVAEKQKINNPDDFSNCENINGYRFDDRWFR